MSFASTVLSEEFGDLTLLSLCSVHQNTSDTKCRVSIFQLCMTEILYSYVLLGVGEHYPLASARTSPEFFLKVIFTILTWAANANTDVESLCTKIPGSTMLMCHYHVVTIQRAEEQPSWYKLARKIDKSPRFCCIYSLDKDSDAKINNQSNRRAPKLTNHQQCRNPSQNANE